MKRSYISITLIATAATKITAFSGQQQPLHRTAHLKTTLTSRNAATASHDMPPYFIDTKEEEKVTPTQPAKVEKKKPKPTGGAKHKEGILSPMVLLAKNALGDKKLNELRAKVIALHSDVIGGFVETSDSALGNAVLKALFEVSDKNQNGKIEVDELADALRTLGFDWLKEKQVHGIFSRADQDENGAIDMEEWLSEAPKTLRTNLIKLAKKNGGELGLLV